MFKVLYREYCEGSVEGEQVGDLLWLRFFTGSIEKVALKESMLETCCV